MILGTLDLFQKESLVVKQQVNDLEERLELIKAENEKVTLERDSAVQKVILSSNLFLMKLYVACWTNEINQ